MVGTTDDASTDPTEGSGDTPAPRTAGLARRAAVRFVVLIGVVSAFSDMTHEGARSITGPFLGSLGASGAVVSIVAGAGELLGYVLRYAAGRAADRTRHYWAITFGGYILQMAVVPLLAVAGSWELAAVFIIAERVGRAIRNPARDAMTAHAAQRLGGGWAFGVREALDAAGATVGPLLIAGVLLLGGTDRFGFVVLAVPAALTIISLLLTWRQFPNPSALETIAPPPAASPARFSGAFWWYLAAMALVAIGYADWPLIALHVSQRHAFSADLLPTLYAVAMAAEAVASLALGKLFDRIGVRAVLLVTILTAGYGPLVFLGGAPLIVVGTIVWGFGMAAQESVIKAVITAIVPAERRASAYGLFDTGFGIAWFAGSVLLGVLYDTSLVAVAIVSAAVQLFALPLILLTARRLRKPQPRPQ